MRLRFIIATLVVAVFAVAAPQAHATVGDALEIWAKITRLDAELDRLQNDIDTYRVDPYYCLPPDEPSKATEYANLDDYKKHLDGLMGEISGARRDLLDAVSNDGRALNAVTKAVPGGGDIQEASFWRRYSDKSRKISAAIEEVRNRIKLAESRRCGPLPETPSTIGTTGTTPPTTTPPSTDPGVALPAVQVRDVQVPSVPDRFCSKAEKDAKLQEFWAVGWDFYMNYQDAREYESAIGQAIRADQGNNDVLTDILPDASAATKYHAKRHDEYHTAYDRVMKMQIEDCDPPVEETGETGVIGDPTEPVTEPVDETQTDPAPEPATTPEGAKPPFEPKPNDEVGSAWPYGRIRLGAYYAEGDMDFADQRELGTEDSGGGNRELGVVGFDRDADATGYGIDLTVGMPGFGKRDWLRFAYETLDADTTERHDVFDTGGDTLLIGGVGEGANPAGFALGYFGGLNTVTDIVGRFEARSDTYSIEYGDDCFWGQCDYCDDCDNEDDEEDYWDCYDYYDCDDCYGPRVGLYGGLRYSVVQFESRINGSIVGFARDFEYRDRIENDIFSVRLGARGVIPIRPLRFVKLDLQGYVSADFNDAEGTTALSFTGFPDGVANLKNDELTWGYGVGAGVTLELTDNVGIRVGGDYTSSKTSPVVIHDGTPSDLELERVEGLTWSLGVRAFF